ncbi:hypothetical protein [Paraoerskovia sediminicola]|nr:hypothetical protein [Paraoerskovia sediminicola]
MSDAAGLELGMSVVGDHTDTALVDGVSVAQDVTEGTDVVTRAIPDGIQMIAVLDSEEADTSIDFALDLPTGPSLESQADGSIHVIVPTEIEVEDQSDSARFDAEVDAILGGAANEDSLDNISEEQWTALEALEPVETSIEVVDTTVATVGAPWATDANGQPLQTTYELSGNTLTQHVQTDDTTAFPLTADPSWWWWTRTTAMCAGEIAVALVPGAKAARILVKAKSYIYRSAKLKSAAAKLGA